MGYAEAIEQQVRVWRHWESADGRALAREIAELTLRTDGRSPSPEHTWLILRNEIANGQPCFVAAPICALIEASAATLPACALEPADLPSLSNWIYFERALRLPAIFPDANDNGPLRAIAVEWLHLLPASAVTGLPRRAMRGTLDPRDVNAVSTTFYIDHPAYSYPAFVSTGLWQRGTPWDEVVEHRGAIRDGAHIVAARRYLATLCAFLRERVLVTPTYAIMNRGARRRLAQALLHEPTVRVVELRKREYVQADESHARSVEWSCQWLVRGHWRNQYFPASGEHRPLWIMPHVKGPADKPLKAPRLTAYEVVR